VSKSEGFCLPGLAQRGPQTSDLLAQSQPDSAKIKLGMTASCAFRPRTRIASGPTPAIWSPIQSGIRLGSHAIGPAAASLLSDLGSTTRRRPSSSSGRFHPRSRAQLSAVRAGLANDRSRRGKRSDATKSEAARRPPLGLGGEPQEKCGLKRAMNDKTRVALHFGHIRLIIVDAVAIESQGRVAKQQEGIAGSDALAGRLRQRDLGADGSRGTGRICGARRCPDAPQTQDRARSPSCGAPSRSTLGRCALP
jgi:hypothetical protein